MVNWTALLGLEQGVKVRKTPGAWIVHVEALYGRHPGELFGLAKNVADRVARGLMQKYGYVLAPGEVCKGYELAVDDPVAQLLSRYFTVSTPRRKMDHSPGEDEGEIDHLSRDAAVEYLLMPERVKKLEGAVNAISSQLEEISSTEVIGRLEAKVDGFGKDLVTLAGEVHQLVRALRECTSPSQSGGVPSDILKREPVGVS
jgi:hypothetical protein